MDVFILSWFNLENVCVDNLKNGILERIYLSSPGLSKGDSCNEVSY